MSDVLVSFLKEQENAPLAAGDMSMMRHSSPEGGTDTVGYGHKLTPEEERSGTVYGIDIATMTAQDAEFVLLMDIHAKRKSLDARLRKEHGVSLNSLSERKQMMLTDYEFNLRGGVSAFPSFTGAVIAGDQAGQVDEMTRFFTDPQGVTKPLARNRAFYSTFMSDAARQALGE